MKTVSVVMATYNGEKYLREQLDSILGQTYAPFEIIIQDDGSTDGTVDIAKEYVQKYGFIKLYVNEHNLGFNQNFKSVAMKATGDYVAISDQDDIWLTPWNHRSSTNTSSVLSSSYSLASMDTPCFASVILSRTPIFGSHPFGMTGALVSLPISIVEWQWSTSR